MDTHLRLDADAAGPVVVKTAAAGAAAARLRREAERLARAVHPGVVALAPVAGGAAGAGPVDEVRTRYVGEPVSSWIGSLASVAGVGASVAATLADLHDVGIVHGRVDASHVLIGDDGRPRLCGLAPADGATRADDVAALAAVVSGLLDRVGDADRRGWARLAHLVAGGGRRGGRASDPPGHRGRPRRRAVPPPVRPRVRRGVARRGARRRAAAGDGGGGRGARLGRPGHVRAVLDPRPRPEGRRAVGRRVRRRAARGAPRNPGGPAVGRGGRGGVGRRPARACCGRALGPAHP